MLAHNIDIDELVLEPLAANEAVLRPEERHMGVAVIDMGGGTTDIAVFVEDGLCHTVILDVGGNHLTNDVAYGLHAPFETAEELKIRYGSVLPERVAEDEKVWASVFGEKAEQSFSRHFITTILEARATEIFEMIRDELEESGYRNRLPAGVVLTGGSNLLPGMTELARSVLGVPARLGAPSHRLAHHGPRTALCRRRRTPPPSVCCCGACTKTPVQYIGVSSLTSSHSNPDLIRTSPRVAEESCCLGRQNVTFHGTLMQSWLCTFCLPVRIAECGAWKPAPGIGSTAHS